MTPRSLHYQAGLVLIKVNSGFKPVHFYPGNHSNLVEPPTCSGADHADPQIKAPPDQSIVLERCIPIIFAVPFLLTKDIYIYYIKIHHDIIFFV